MSARVYDVAIVLYLRKISFAFTRRSRARVHDEEICISQVFDIVESEIIPGNVYSNIK